MESEYVMVFNLLISLVLGYFWLDKKNMREDLKTLEEKVNHHSTAVEVLEEKIKAVKEDTGYIRRKLEGA